MLQLENKNHQRTWTGSWFPLWKLSILLGSHVEKHSCTPPFFPLLNSSLWRGPRGNTEKILPRDANFPILSQALYLSRLRRGCGANLFFFPSLSVSNFSFSGDRHGRSTFPVSGVSLSDLVPSPRGWLGDFEALRREHSAVCADPLHLTGALKSPGRGAPAPVTVRPATRGCFSGLQAPSPSSPPFRRNWEHLLA